MIHHELSLVGLLHMRPSQARWVRVDCILGYDADMMMVEYCRGFQR